MKHFYTTLTAIGYIFEKTSTKQKLSKNMMINKSIAWKFQAGTQKGPNLFFTPE